jgi:1-acyl-sn-glycerol-3-phosphate acyltransferase
MHKVLAVHVHNGEVVQQALEAGQGVMIAPNHPSHCDPHAIYDAADIVGTPLFMMATWHVFDMRTKFGQWLLQKIGCFSVDRDGADMKAFKEAIRILQEEKFPLVIFPEGEIYHCNDRVTPFLEGPAMMASTAARKSERDIVIIPSAMKYRYLNDPTEELVKVMSELELSIFWRPRPHKPLPERIYEFSEAVLSLKELEFTGSSSNGPLSERVKNLSDFILTRHETTRGIDSRGKTIPERVKEIRRRCVKEICDEKSPPGEAELKQLFEQLDDSFLVGQLFSYPGNYVAEMATIERIAETIDKFEEDALRRPTAGIRGTRECHVCFGEPITVSGDRRTRKSPSELTRQMETAVQQMLDQFAG